MTPFFKGVLWILFIIALFAGMHKAKADEIKPGTLFVHGSATFCNKLEDAEVLAKAGGTPIEQATMRSMMQAKKCGTYEGPFLVIEKRKVVNGKGIYYASTLPFEGNPKGYVFMFSAEPNKLTI